ncbi:MAG: type IV pilus modification PilV family protein [Sulfuricaulis sp.]
MNTRRSRFGMHGVTLVELIVAIVIIGVALAGVLTVIVRNTTSSADPMIWHQSVAIGEAYLEEILAKNFTPTTTPGENRATYDDVSDYAGLVNNGCLTTDAACPVLGSCACDQTGAPIDALQGYTVAVAVTPPATAWNGIAPANVWFVQVTVSSPAGGSVVLSGYRTNYDN